MTTNEMVMYDELVELGIATPEELNLAHNLVSGTWEEVLNSVLFVRTGYRSIQQMVEAEDEEEETDEQYEDYEPDDCDYDEGFDPYMGCFSYDC